MHNVLVVVVHQRPEPAELVEGRPCVADGGPLVESKVLVPHVDKGREDKHPGQTFPRFAERSPQATAESYQTFHHGLCSPFILHSKGAQV